MTVYLYANTFLIIIIKYNNFYLLFAMPSGNNEATNVTSKRDKYVI